MSDKLVKILRKTYYFVIPKTWQEEQNLANEIWWQNKHIRNIK